MIIYDNMVFWTPFSDKPKLRGIYEPRSKVNAPRLSRSCRLLASRGCGESQAVHFEALQEFSRLKWLNVKMDDYGWLMREVLFLAVFTFCCFWEEWTMSNPDSWRSGHIMKLIPEGLHCFTASPIFPPSFWSFDSFWLNGSEDFYASKSEGSKWAISDLCAYAGEAWCQGRFLDGGWWRSKAFYGFVCPQLKDHAPAKWAGEKY